MEIMWFIYSRGRINVQIYCSYVHEVLLVSIDQEQFKAIKGISWSPHGLCCDCSALHLNERIKLRFYCFFI